MTIVLCQAGIGMGNQRPEPILELEKVILNCVFRVAVKPEDLVKELHLLIKSEIWKQCEALESSSEAARFFIRT